MLWTSFPTLSILTHFPWHLREHLPQWELPNNGTGGPHRKENYIRWLSRHFLLTLSSKVGEILTDHVFRQISWNLIQPWLLSLSLSHWWSLDYLDIASVTVSVTVVYSSRLLRLNVCLLGTVARSQSACHAQGRSPEVHAALAKIQPWCQPCQPFQPCHSPRDSQL